MHHLKISSVFIALIMVFAVQEPLITSCRLSIGSFGGTSRSLVVKFVYSKKHLADELCQDLASVHPRV